MTARPIGAAAPEGDNRTTHEPLASIPAHRVMLNAGYRFLAAGVTLGGRLSATAKQDRTPDIPGTARQSAGCGLAFRPRPDGGLLPVYDAA